MIDAQTATRIIPDIMIQGDTALAAALLRSENPREAGWLPEAMSLLAMPELTAADRAMILRRIWPLHPALHSAAHTQTLAQIAARIGMAGYSFPRWRFTAQGFNGGALMERFGMTRLQRVTDRFDPALPPTFENDRYGTGFIRHDGDFTAEYRRTYILLASRKAGSEAAIVIRNNSWYFRDRLKQPAYIGWAALSPAQCEAIADHDFAAYDTPLRAWQDAFSTVPMASDTAIRADLPLPEKQRRVTALLDQFDALEGRMDLWLRGAEGRVALGALIRHICTRPQTKAPANGQHSGSSHSRTPQKGTRKGIGSAPFYLAATAASAPPWQPQAVIGVNLRVARVLHAAKPENTVTLGTLFNALAQPAMRLDLLSGPRGDRLIPPQEHDAALRDHLRHQAASPRL